MALNKILLPEAPNFSKYLEETFEGIVEVSEVREIRQGFNSKRNKALTLILGPDEFRRRIDEDKFYELQQQYPEAGRFFIGPFYKCQRTRITFRRPETSELIAHRETLKADMALDLVDTIMEDILTRNKGELRVYPEEKDEEGRMPIIYQGFRPGVGYPGRSGVDDILAYGTFKKLNGLRDYFNIPASKETRGSFLNNHKWMRYDNHSKIPFP